MEDSDIRSFPGINKKINIKVKTIYLFKYPKVILHLYSHIFIYIYNPSISTSGHVPPKKKNPKV